MIFKHKAILRMVASAGLLFGAVQAQAQTAYNVDYSQSFTGLFLGAPAAHQISGSFSATDLNGDNWLSTVDNEIDLASFTFNIDGDALNDTRSGAAVDQVNILWFIGDANLTMAGSGVSIASVPAAGAGYQWQAGPVIGLPAGVQGHLTLFDSFASVTGYDPGLATGAPVFSYTVTPIPEPQTYLMMLAGIAGLAAFARRRAS